MFRASHPRNEEQASQTSATSDAQEQRGEREEAEAREGNDARESDKEHLTQSHATAWREVFMQSGERKRISDSKHLSGKTE